MFASLFHAIITVITFGCSMVRLLRLRVVSQLIGIRHSLTFFFSPPYCCHQVVADDQYDVSKDTLVEVIKYLSLGSFLMLMCMCGVVGVALEFKDVDIRDLRSRIILYERALRVAERAHTQQHDMDEEHGREDVLEQGNDGRYR